ncbi:hypothetical protein [Acidovorax sp. A1169]|uniref:hypothetical protein n=1 Tax=Acidovorax sp. A1169 TaxID=3059524 RepID=UPI002737E0D2|nr:hypothetical protein [Acidovorax sp. A1169]MDP4076196.1 hypothetical protein [Acidovorax sp. A1169]
MTERQPDARLRILAAAAGLIAEAGQAGLVVTIATAPKLPLAMGHYKMAISVRDKRGAPGPAAEVAQEVDFSPIACPSTETTGVAAGALAEREVKDAIRSAYDLGYNDARGMRAVTGDGAPGYRGQQVEKDHGGALLARLRAIAPTEAAAPDLPQAARAQPSAPAVAWRERMGPKAAWTPCSKEHHDWVLRAPAEWPGVEVQALAVAGPYVPFKALQAAFAMRSPTCWCESCDAIANDGHRSRMSLCPSCGDKRCPRALHHEHDCQFGAPHGQPT